MAKLKVPSLQHLARVWHPDPTRVQKALVALVKNSPTFSYEIVFELVRDLIHLKIPYDQIVRSVNLKVQREDVRRNFLSLLPLVRNHFENTEISFVAQVARRFYPIGRGISVPFSPPFVYGSGGSLHLPWFSFWRSNPLDRERLSLFMTVVDDILSQDPDLESAELSFLDFSAPKPREDRELTVLRGSEIPRVTKEKRDEMLMVFVQGFQLAQIELSNISSDTTSSDKKPRDDTDQRSLFE